MGTRMTRKIGKVQEILLISVTIAGRVWIDQKMRDIRVVIEERVTMNSRKGSEKDSQKDQRMKITTTIEAKISRGIITAGIQKIGIAQKITKEDHYN